MACSDYERIPRDFQVTDRLHSHYQSIEVLYGKQEADACLYMDDYLHMVSSIFPGSNRVDHVVAHSPCFMTVCEFSGALP